MKTKFPLLIFLITLSTAYAQKALSLHPLFTEQDAILRPEMEGRWGIPGLDQTFSLQKAGDNFYFLNYENKNTVLCFEAVLVRIKDEIFLDLSGVMPDTLGDESYRSSFITGHSFYKIQLTKDTMQLYEISYPWLYDYALKQKLPLNFEWVPNAMLLTSGTDDLQAFFAEYGQDQALFKAYLSLEKKQKDPVEETVVTPSGAEISATATILQKCLPEFPLKDGWLGGDGDVSVPINETTTLFIFSDTYVGSEHQQSRQEGGMGMVSNSVAVETCLPNGGTDVQYFWNDRYSEHPEPIFKTYTDRYKFWVQDAFMIKDNLYVLLEKIGPRLGLAPNDIFPFSLLGFTLAKVSNPDETPNKWKIELIPLRGFGNPFLGIRCHAKQDDYIYFFVSRYDKAQVLLRKQMNDLDNPDTPYEYYALDKTWKAGLDVEDMDTIINGFRSTTINYHPEIKQWVMISDIQFMENTIKMRTAPALTGPWSDEIVIYEIPETTPGNPAFSKSNFCYLPRECIQNYDSENQVMLLTYDINNFNFSEVNSNPKIYTPRVITIPLK